MELKKYIKTIFDSDINKWMMTSSVFENKLVGEKSIVFIIEDMNENIFGAYIENKITNY